MKTTNLFVDFIIIILFLNWNLRHNLKFYKLFRIKETANWLLNFLLVIYLFLKIKTC